MMYLTKACLLIACFFSACKANSICHGKYGCFSGEEPFDRGFVQLPESPNDLDIQFTLFTRDSSTGHLLDDSDVTKLKTSSFKGTRNTKIVAHGFKGNDKKWYVGEFITELLKRDDINLIIINWQKAATFPYAQACGNTRIVGAMVAEMILFLSNQVGNTAMDYHVIGFSLGAQIAGYTGSYLKGKGHTLGRISGLDPAAPYFEGEHLLVRLDKSDADFVDVIHTDGRTLGIFGAGVLEPTGHVDFYPNGGYRQPGCYDLVQTAKDFLDRIWRLPFELVVCSHYRSIRYFVESINSPGKMQGFKCGSKEDFDEGKCLSCENGVCPILGYDAVESKNTAQGSYFLSTQRSKPFYAFPYKVTFYTGTGTFGGNDDSVNISVTGTKGNSGYIKMNKRYHDQGSVVSLVATSKMDTGEPLSIKVKKGGIVDPWKLHKVVIQAALPNQSKQYTACFDQWLYPHFSVTKSFQEGGNISC